MFMAGNSNVNRTNTGKVNPGTVGSGTAVAGKKKGRRLKRSVCRTFGALFMASAIAVAAIPTEGLMAAGEGTPQARVNRQGNYKVTISKDAAEKAANVKSGSACPTMDTLIPVITADDKIYTTGETADGSTYQFAYKSVDGVYQAILLGYQHPGELRDGELTIPDEVEAYTQPSGNMGTGRGYVAANANGQPLYYEKLTKRVYTYNVQDPLYPSDPTKTIERRLEYYEGVMTPCYQSDKSEWGDLDLKDFYFEDAANAQGATGKAEDLDTASPNNPVLTAHRYPGYRQTEAIASNQWIKSGAVVYIGNQYLSQEYDSATQTYTWTVGTGANSNYITSANQGLFYGQGNIKKLNIGSYLSGVGNYAFYGCTALEEISFKNGLKVIGNWAFANNGKLARVNVPDASNLQQIGDHAFYNCGELNAIQVPTSVIYIGDYAFAEDKKLNSVTLCGSNGAAALRELGWGVFENCASLSKLVLPDQYTETVDISIFKGCQNLRFVTCLNESTSFKDDDGVYSFEEFRRMLQEDPVNGTFYFEGTVSSLTAPAASLHKLCRDECFAFSYLKYDSEKNVYEPLDMYELTVAEEGADPNDETRKSTYIVNSANRLISATIGTKVEELNIPDNIGPYHIYTLGANTFANRCSLKRVRIPSHVQTIEAGTFQGCHNVEYVIFETDKVQIGTDAFKTQDFAATAQHTCGSRVPTGKPAVELVFVGNISPDSTPYQYAMSYQGRYNNSTQEPTFITYYSGFPTNLTVEYVGYDPGTGTGGHSELTNFPKLAELTSYTRAKYPYLTEDQEKAAEMALQNYNNGVTLPEDQQAFINSALRPTIPTGIQTVKDGLFAGSDAKAVNIYGLDAIEGPELSISEGRVTVMKPGDFYDCDSLEEVNIYGSPAYVGSYAFADCNNLKMVSMSGDIKTIGDYAFADCTVLGQVSIPATTESLGVALFAGCSDMGKDLEDGAAEGSPKIPDVNFQNNPNFVYENSMIFSKNGSGKTLLECLPGKRASKVYAGELEGVSAIAQEAFRTKGVIPGTDGNFRGTSQVKKVDLSTSTIVDIPNMAFAYSAVEEVTLPPTCRRISGERVFEGSSLEYLEAPRMTTSINEKAFDGLKVIETDRSALTVCTDPDNEDLIAYANNKGFTLELQRYKETYAISFIDYSSELNKLVIRPETLYVKEDEKPLAEDIPKEYGKTGEVFVGWFDELGNEIGQPISENVTYTATYRIPTHSVTFVDYKNEPVDTPQQVTHGGTINKKIITPPDPREGYTFTGEWLCLVPSGATLDSPVTQDMIFMAQYKQIDTSETRHAVSFIDYNGNLLYGGPQMVDHNGKITEPRSPQREGWIFKEWIGLIPVGAKLDEPVTQNMTFQAYYEQDQSPTQSTTPPPGTTSTPPPGTTSTPPPGTTNTPAPGETNTPAPGTTLYTLTVIGGSGSGSYAAGALVPIVANTPAAGMEFASWTVSPAETKVISLSVSGTVVTMPEQNVTITANYKTRTDSGNNNPVDPNRPTGTARPGNGTTVVIDKNGLSNTGVVNVVVNGSSDNFTIRISENAAATEAVLKALIAEYGNNLENIKYFPMDISLYDSTGTRLITDTTGLSIDITLPLPDSMRVYAGNNKVAGVVNNRLDKLSPKFTTINGVPCVTFRAEHFSPYVIYVDTSRLGQGSTADDTPKTGDGIHPKWFLSIGLACLSLVMFMQKDTRKKEKAAVKVKR